MEGISQQVVGFFGRGSCHRHLQPEEKETKQKKQKRNKEQQEQQEEVWEASLSSSLFPSLFIFILSLSVLLSVCLPFFLSYLSLPVCCCRAGVSGKQMVLVTPHPR